MGKENYKFRRSFSFEGKRYEVYGNSQEELLLRMFEKKKALEEGRVTVYGNTLVSKWFETAMMPINGI